MTVRKIYQTSFSGKNNENKSLFLCAQVFRHNNPHFQKLQNWADLRQHSFSDKLIIY